MHVAVLGGTGFIGRATVLRLFARGAEVSVIHRGKRGAPADSAASLFADRMDRDSVAAALNSSGADVLVDILPMTGPNTAPVLAAAKGTVDRYLMVSSADVYANYGGLIGDESTTPLYRPAREDDPLRARRYPFRQDGQTDDPNQKFFNDYDKIVVEELAAEAFGDRLTVVRLPMVFGPGDGQHRFKWMVDAVRRGEVIEIDSRAANWRSTFGFIDDVADAIALAAVSDAAVGRTYNCGYPDAPTTAEWVGRIADRLDVDVPIVTVPPEHHGVLFDMAEGSNLDFPLTLDTGRIRAELGFSEIVPPGEAMDRTIAWEDAFEPGKAAP